LRPGVAIDLNDAERIVQRARDEFREGLGTFANEAFVLAVQENQARFARVAQKARDLA
jgi:tetrahydromethanopterin S-methyltransferase subunit A